MAIIKIRNQAIDLDAAEIPNLDASKITTGELANARVADLPTSKVTSGTFADARIASSNVTQHVTDTDLQPIKSDLTALALREATNEASAAFNLPNQFIDTFATDVLGTKTTVAVSGGAVITETSTADPNAISIFRPNTTDHSTSTTSVSSLVSGDSATLQEVNTAYGGNNLSNTYQKFSGSMSLTTADAGDGGWKVVPTTDYNFGTNDFTIEGWAYNNSISLDGSHRYIMDWNTSTGSRLAMGFNTGETYFGQTLYSNNFRPSSGFSTVNGMANGTWTHWAWVKSSGNLALYFDGHRQATYSDSLSYNFESQSNAAMSFGQRHASDANGQLVNLYQQEIRVSDNARYSGATYTIPTAQFSPTTSAINATGTAEQAANTVASNKTKVGGTMLYKDEAGTATLGSANDLAIYFTCNGGTNWTEAASYNAITPVYSTGIKQVRLGETTCTQGTDVRYKAVWANQSGGSKETQLHGIGINY